LRRNFLPAVEKRTKEIEKAKNLPFPHFCLIMQEIIVRRGRSPNRN